MTSLEDQAWATWATCWCGDISCDVGLVQLFTITKFYKEYERSNDDVICCHHNMGMDQDLLDQGGWTFINPSYWWHQCGKQRDSWTGHLPPWMTGIVKNNMATRLKNILVHSASRPCPPINQQLWDMWGWMRFNFVEEDTFSSVIPFPFRSVFFGS